MSQLRKSYLHTGPVHTYSVVDPGSQATSLTVMELSDAAARQIIGLAPSAAWMVQGGRLHVGLFSHLARPDRPDPLTEPCELLGRCIADAYSGELTRTLFGRAAEGRWNTDVVFELLTALHYGEVQS